MMEEETVSLLVRLHEHKQDPKMFPEILAYADEFYANQATKTVDHYIMMCYMDLWIDVDTKRTILDMVDEEKVRNK